MVTAHLAHFNDCCTGGCQGPCQGGCQGGYNGGAGGELVYIRSCQPQRHATKYHTRHVRTRYRHRGYSSHQTVNVRVSKHDSGNVCTEDCDKESVEIPAAEESQCESVAAEEVEEGSPEGDVHETTSKHGDKTCKKTVKKTVEDLGRRKIITTTTRKVCCRPGEEISALSGCDDDASIAYEGKEYCCVSTSRKRYSTKAKVIERVANICHDNGECGGVLGNCYLCCEVDGC